YHGKLVKLATDIFHTHHHLADGRLEVLTALGLDLGFGLDELRQLRSAASIDAAFQGLPLDLRERLGLALASTVERRSRAYVDRYGDWSMRIGAVLFDRSRSLRWHGPMAKERFFRVSN
ncbi:MAG: cobalt-precorrin-5B (C(1))-methyltransferase, partial [Cyanobacteria bacterium]|nr:cobalt-precorrin-5B (C(1))-methyltransferase [Cyanobacteriota bacterium]